MYCDLSVIIYIYYKLINWIQQVYIHVWIKNNLKVTTGVSRLTQRKVEHYQLLPTIIDLVHLYIALV